MFSSMITAAIFDVDGVIVDSEPLAQLAYESLFALYGVTFPKNERGMFFDAGEREQDVLLKVKNEYHVDDSIEAMMEKREVLYKDILKNLVARPGVESLL